MLYCDKTLGVEKLFYWCMQKLIYILMIYYMPSRALVVTQLCMCYTTHIARIHTHTLDNGVSLLPDVNSKC